MGYSSPKKQLDLKDFLSRPATPGKPRNKWTRTASASATQPDGKTPADKTPDKKPA